MNKNSHWIHIDLRQCLTEKEIEKFNQLKVLILNDENKNRPIWSKKRHISNKYVITLMLKNGIKNFDKKFKEKEKDKENGK